MDDTDRYIERLERRGTLVRKVGVGVVIAVVVALVAAGGTCAWHVARDAREAEAERVASSQRATAAQVAAVDAAVDAFEAGAATRVAAWRAAMSRAAQVVPRPDLGACPIELPVRQPHDASRGGSFNNLDAFDAIVMPGRQGFPHAVARGEPPEAPPAVEAARAAGARLRERIREPGRVEDFTAMVGAARALGGGLTHDVVLLASELQRPVAAPGGHTFTPGHVRGVAVLYDYATGSIACAGEVEAGNTSARVEYAAQTLFETSSLQDQLTAEFDAEVERAIARGVRWRAGERPVEADAGPDAADAASE